VPTQRYLGRALFRLKKYRDSIDQLKKVVDLEPDDKESLFTMGKAYYELTQYDVAVRVFSHLRPDPQIGPSAALLAGSIRLKNHEPQQAIMDFEIGLRHEKIPPDVQLELKYRLAAAYTAEQDLGKAVPLLQEIYKINPGYKDVAAQLSKGRELHSNRNLQTFLMAPSSEFVSLCRRVVNGFVPQSKVKIIDVSVNKSEYTDILAEIETARWMDTILFRFIRTTGQVGELLLRDMHSRIKDLRAGRGYCLVPGSFSEEAHSFVEARLIDLVAKDKLMKILQQTA
jgi:tetratricopeptide (TPR) repeat protein